MQTITVIGLGTMGHGIAQTFAVAGYGVRMFDENETVRDSVIARIQQNLEVMLQNGLLDSIKLDDVISRMIVYQSEQEACEQSEFIIEAIAEDLDIKRAFFGRCEKIVPQSTILASNTSSFPSSLIATGLSHPTRCINTHWFNPAHVIPVVEVIPGEHTAEDVVDKVMALLQSIGKQPIRLHKEVPGFVLNRLQVALFREMLDLVDQGVISPGDLDQAVRGSLAIRWAAAGPMRVGDFGGWDVLSKVYENIAPSLRSDSQIHDILAGMVSRGEYGIKSGQGFYEYPQHELLNIHANKDKRFMAWAEMLSDSITNDEQG
jgi:3-hydroxybutyryl-CoA dehydrogenase